MTSSHASRMKHESTVTWLSTVILYCLVLLGWVFFNLDLWSSIHRLLNLNFLWNRPIANPWNLNDSQIVKFYRTFRIIVIKLMIFLAELVLQLVQWINAWYWIPWSGTLETDVQYAGESIFQITIKEKIRKKF